MSRYRPRHQPQLNRGTPVPGRTRGSRDCGPRTWQMGIDAVTKGRKRPSVANLRKRGEVPGPQTTNIFDAKKAVESFAGLEYWEQRGIAKVKRAARNERPVHVCVHYGVWNRQMKNRTGDPNFTGGHSMLICGQRTYRGEVQWLLYDPLEDARRSSIPQGPRWVPRSRVIRAMEAFGGGRGKCYAGVFGGKLQ